MIDDPADTAQQKSILSFIYLIRLKQVSLLYHFYINEIYFTLCSLVLRGRRRKKETYLLR